MAISREELKARILYAQHLTAKSDLLTVCQDLNGFQAQYMTNVYHGLQIRCREPLEQTRIREQLVKSWTIRGTLHAFAEADLPLFLHADRRHYLREVDTAAADEFIGAERKKILADRIVNLIGSGVNDRAALKEHCQLSGMTEQESKSIFNAWGGTLRDLAERGILCYQAQQKKTFRLCPTFQPLAESTAKLEILRRYFTHFAPATVKDAAYYLGCTQAEVREYLQRLPVRAIELENRTYFQIEQEEKEIPEIPACLFLAGFDQLMLGYAKEQNPFLPQEAIRGIFNLAGIVMPAILLRGSVVGKWKKQKNRLSFTLFWPLTELDQKVIEESAEQAWSEIKKISWE